MSRMFALVWASIVYAVLFVSVPVEGVSSVEKLCAFPYTVDRRVANFSGWVNQHFLVAVNTAGIGEVKWVPENDFLEILFVDNEDDGVVDEISFAGTLVNTGWKDPADENKTLQIEFTASGPVTFADCANEGGTGTLDCPKCEFSFCDDMAYLNWIYYTDVSGVIFGEDIENVSPDVGAVCHLGNAGLPLVQVGSDGANLRNNKFGLSTWMICDGLSLPHNLDINIDIDSCPPTSTPTVSPTPLPTTSPTGSPTTPLPTTAPTGSPTTPLPTSSPTGSPTTPLPTTSPTGPPTTPLPTTSPTGSPTTPIPTTSPTNSPTPLPTTSPTDSPTDPPTPLPTVSPSPLPTSEPTASPYACPDPVVSCPIIATSMAQELPTGTFTRFESGNDVVYLIREPNTKISTKIRCTANYNSGLAYNSRLGIEDLIDPIPNRTKQCGYCPTDIMGRTGSTANTDDLDATGLCGKLPTNVEIGQAICHKSLQIEGYDECVNAICSQYWFPNYNDKQDCIDQFDSNPEKGFCILFTVEGTADYEECRDDIKDFGWEYAADKYMPKPEESDCSSDPNDFPAELTECQTGAEIQYFENDEWKTYLGVPSDSNRPVCPEGLKFNAVDDKKLFVNPVRVKQESQPRDTCVTVSTCTVVQRVSSELIYSRASSCTAPTPPSPSPTPTPLPPVNGVTLCNSIYNSDTCVPIPQFNGSSGDFSAELNEMEECCAPKDTEPLPGGSTIDPNYNFQRYSQACNPICDEGNPSSCCDDLTKDDELDVLIVFSGTERDALCCDSCTCYGDPRCISFRGIKKSWIPCDSRDKSTVNKNNFCFWTKSLCETLVDPAGNSCVWVPSSSTSKGWSSVLNGGPCKPIGGDGSGAESCMLMYETDYFKMFLKQADRGIITQAIVTLGDEQFLLDSTECLTDLQPWKKVTLAP